MADLPITDHVGPALLWSDDTGAWMLCYHVQYDTATLDVILNGGAYRLMLPFKAALERLQSSLLVDLPILVVHPDKRMTITDDATKVEALLSYE